ncbi:kinectin-like isoform X2 [Argiope bruennichi]|uniref:Kinectin like protein n=1 Tax=Argiope bruennichi TaxID=94029 RepID=A0A8T0EK78_ARGBR|nr:kinectin-like isoform X2 [Argiope bruennichi]KAF8773998.1 Kinectin like protein [Argiope bruennichi]
MNNQATPRNVHHWFEDTMTWFSSSAMDLQTFVICGGVFVFSALVVYLISVFGMRERTYEEAMEEQRRRNQEAVHHTKSDKNKKEKKFKKWGKRKEKVDEDKNHSCDGENKAISEDIDSKGEADVNSSSSQTVESKGSSVKKRVRQRKAIVLEKEEDASQPISSSDDTDDLPSLCSSPVTKQPMEEHLKTTTSDKSIDVKEDFKNDNLEMGIELQNNFKEKVEISESVKPSRKSPTKKTKKVKSEHLEFATEFREGNESRILTMIKTTSLSEDEIQAILDALGAKQKFNEKKKSEISALKKVIQEKEDALRNEQKLLQSANERINELIQELSDEKSQASATEKSLRDALNQEQQEIKALHGMMQRKREQYGSEISSLQSKMQQMKNKMKEEHSIALQRLQDENNQLQSLNRMESEKQQRGTMEISRLQHEVDQLRSSRDKFESHQAAVQEDLRRQIQQLEKHIEQLISSHQEEEYSYKQRINEMSNKIQQTENARSSLVQELQNAQSVCSTLEADNSTLRQRLDEAKHQLKNSEQELLQLQSRLEESNRQQRDLANCLEKMRDEVMDLSNFKREQLQIIQTLKQENEVLVSQVNQKLPESSEHQQQNGDFNDKSKLIEIEEHEAIIQEKENMLHRLLQELEHCKCEIVSLSNELENQRKMNKELNNKNKELVEQLKQSEAKFEEIVKKCDIKVQEAQIKMDKDFQNRLNKQIKEVEQALRQSFEKELENIQKDAENIKKDADERLMKSESEANIRLEEFQESLYDRLNQINSEAEKKVNDAIKEKERMENELQNLHSSIKIFLQRIFPNLNVPESMENKVMLTKYETEIRCFIEELKGDKSHDSKDVENLMKKLDVAAQEKVNLESQIRIYESVLAETESILKNLQNNIENEEKRWKLELHCKDETLKEVLSENEELKSENKNLRTNLEQLQGLREALYEIEELRVKLQKEESEKKMLLEKIGNLDSTNTSSIPLPENNILQFPQSNILPTKSEKRKKSRKRGASGKK